MLLFLLLVIPQLSSGELGEHDALCGPGDACYALFYQRKGFLESWRACRDRGGNLATIKNVQEAALVEQLLTSSTSFRGDGDLVQLRIWIGLQRQPRQCAPLKPLRGFTWTTGDQDTAYTNWVNQPVHAGSPGLCSAPRCVAIGVGYGKPEDDFKWLEGSCTLPVDGFLCKFRYQGMCPALSEGAVLYTAPFGYQGNWLDRLPFGSVAKVTCEGQQQDVSVLCILKQDGTVGWHINEPLCQPYDTMKCSMCQQLCDERGVCSCKEGYILQPDGHSCEPETEMSFEEHNPAQGCPCQYQCVGLNKDGTGYQCICPEGYQLATDGHSCEDIDECEDGEEGEEGPCEHACQNAPGSYVCSCDLGFTVSEDDPARCVDVDECRIARVCKQMCVNYVGGFECFCSEGYELDVDGVSCKSAGHREVSYEPQTPVSTSEEFSEEETGIWYPQPVDTAEGFESEWKMTGTTTGGREGRWDSHQPTGGEWGWTENVESWEEETTAGPEITKPTTRPFIFKWEESEEKTTEPPVDEWADITPSVLVWEEDEAPASSTTAVPTHTIPFVVSWEEDKTMEDDTIIEEAYTTTLPAKTSPPSTTMAPVPPTTNIPLDKVTAAAWPGVKVTTSSTEQYRNLPDERTLSPKRFIVIETSPTTIVAKEKMDEVLATKPTPRIPLPKNTRKTIPTMHPSVSPLPAQETKGKRDTRWLAVALLVPLCIFLVIMLAFGIVYCTRCGGDSKPRSVTDCYHWVTGGGSGKGPAPSGVETPSCRTGV
ncbi:endosialin [Bombina bombina]|uniref:endosialin n=1 Tax=Bombina bombina TaxID=8345 RepID=UPI00235A6C6C|nr:endosialin [Bombina bombina]